MSPTEITQFQQLDTIQVTGIHIPIISVTAKSALVMQLVKRHFSYLAKGILQVSFVLCTYFETSHKRIYHYTLTEEWE